MAVCGNHQVFPIDYDAVATTVCVTLWCDGSHFCFTQARPMPRPAWPREMLILHCPAGKPVHQAGILCPGSKHTERAGKVLKCRDWATGGQREYWFASSKIIQNWFNESAQASCFLWTRLISRIVGTCRYSVSFMQLMTRHLFTRARDCGNYDTTKVP